MVDRIHHQSGQALVLQMAFTDPDGEQAVIADFNTARDSEYAEVQERLPELRRELAEEQARATSPTSKSRSLKLIWSASTPGRARSPLATWPVL